MVIESNFIEEAVPFKSHQGQGQEVWSYIEEVEDLHVLEAFPSGEVPLMAFHPFLEEGPSSLVGIHLEEELPLEGAVSTYVEEAFLLEGPYLEEAYTVEVLLAASPEADLGEVLPAFITELTFCFL